MMSNTKIWDAVKGSHPAYVSKMKHGARLDTVKGIYMVRRATEYFGPCGHGWGYEIEQVTQESGLWLVQGHVWYRLDGFRRIPFLATKPVKDHKGNPDPDAVDKALTGGVKKALSRLGFCADVYSGLGARGETPIAEACETVEAALDPKASRLWDAMGSARIAGMSVDAISEVVMIPQNLVEWLFQSPGWVSDDVAPPEVRKDAADFARSCGLTQDDFPEAFERASGSQPGPEGATCHQVGAFVLWSRVRDWNAKDIDELVQFLRSRT